jgi:hypothetical protein
MKQLWDRLTQKIWNEGYEIGVESAYLQIAKEIKRTLKENELDAFTNQELKLGFDHARQAVLNRLNELEGN